MAIVFAKVHFKGTPLTASIGHEAGYNLIETIEIFKGYFEQNFPSKEFERITLYLSESDMHSGRVWQETRF